ncbi:hypothetical protein GXP71_18030 [Cellulomonas sp. H30R-01]|uniref:hypothetical protein n=1 Tax=Cellulomonas sp. H30R-01 TaxID=2704467 RepID=UPI00138BA863|nr:hypothetical protein [Cellulomonas sp. H30R-01]QHT57786.1 hypothetical protein GXP71_18030 [Cellulomonas sp. H30R-01]
MRFVVLRYGGTSTRPARGTDLLDELTTGGLRGTRPGPQPAGPAPASADPAPASANRGSDPDGRGSASAGSSPAPAGHGPGPGDDEVAAALAAILAPPRAPRDDLAALAAVLGVTTVLDETLGSPDVATTVRSRAEGLTLTDGTAAAPDGPLVGLHVLDAPDLDALVDVLTLLPAGTFEVHPVVAA